MKILPVYAAMCLFSTVLVAQTTTSFHSTAEGAFLRTSVNGTEISIDVLRGSTESSLMAFAVTSNSDGSTTEVSALGAIPNADFVNGGVEHMSLNVDTSQVPGFRSTSCTFSFTPFFTSSCSQGPTGLIQVNWTNNRINSTSVLRERHLTIGGSVTIDFHENFDENSANANGTFLGLVFSASDDASIRLNRETTITITQ
jgi:hypothetical protein